jgi:hypothetical protein
LYIIIIIRMNVAEDEGWRVGTVRVMEMPPQVEEAPNRMFRQGRELEGRCVRAESDDRVQIGPGYPLSECSADEAAEDEWWSLGSIRPNPGGGGAGAQRPRAPQHPPGDTAWASCPVSAKRRKLRKRPETTLDQDWEKARRNAWLRQMLSDTSSDEDEERYGRFAESGRWMTELFEIPQLPAPTSGGECFG